MFLVLNCGFNLVPSFLDFVKNFFFGGMDITTFGGDGSGKGSSGTSTVTVGLWSFARSFASIGIGFNLIIVSTKSGCGSDGSGDDDEELSGVGSSNGVGGEGVGKSMADGGGDSSGVGGFFTIILIGLTKLLPLVLVMVPSDSSTTGSFREILITTWEVFLAMVVVVEEPLLTTFDTFDDWTVMTLVIGELVLLPLLATDDCIDDVLLLFNEYVVKLLFDCFPHVDFFVKMFPTLNCGFGRSSFLDLEKNFLAGATGILTMSECDVFSLGDRGLDTGHDLSGEVDRRVKCECCSLDIGADRV